MSDAYNDPFGFNYDPGRAQITDGGTFGSHKRSLARPVTIEMDQVDDTIARLITRYSGENESESISPPPASLPAVRSDADVYAMLQPQGYAGSEIYPAFAFMAPTDLSYEFKRGMVAGGTTGFFLGILAGFFLFRRRR